MTISIIILLIFIKVKSKKVINPYFFIKQLNITTSINLKRKNNKKEIIHKYKKQIEIYADVLSKLTGKKVKEKYLYLFGIDEQVKVD